MAKTNYAFAKRQRDLAKKQRKAEKQQRKAADAAPDPQSQPSDAASPALGNETTPTPPTE